MPFRKLALFSVALLFALESVQPLAAQEPGGEAGGVLAPDEAAPPVRRSKKRRAPAALAVSGETLNGLAGRYAVLREKRDTGCMITLDNARIKGGARAQLAPGCRDQGIVIFDPAQWGLAQGELVLTARAGHKTRFVKAAEGAWTKDPKDGGKPLALKRL